MEKTTSDQLLYALERRFWERVLDGADNIAYRLVFNSIIRCANALGEEAQRWSISEVKEAAFHLPVALAIAAGDAKRAEAKVRATLEAGLSKFAARLSNPPRLSDPLPRVRTGRAKRSQ
jgi:DNA-binding FadR family transcriptional regulator